MLVGNVDDVHKKQSAQVVVHTGQHGFHLLEEALLALVAAAGLCCLSGLAILVLAGDKKETSKT